jgi:tetraacyldisaccharide 4'-kinase
LWYGAAPPPLPLRWLSHAFGALLRLRRAAYALGICRAQRVALPVVVVGNLTVGGSGKTPLVIWLSEQLRSQGLRPGVILRGYGGSAQRHDTALGVEPDSDVAVVGDEALLLRLRTAAPVVVCRDRVRAARHLLQHGVDIILADDGLQHLRLERDCEIAVLDGRRLLGNGYLLPAGPLREPATRLQQMDIVVVNGPGGDQGHGGEDQGYGGAAAGAVAGALHMQLRGDRLHSLDGGPGRLALASLAGEVVHALAGIGNPPRFFALLQSAGLRVIAHAFPDHHRYRAAELEFGDGRPLLMTEKDAVKCRAFAAANRWYLPVTAEFAAADARALLARLQSCLVRCGR